LNSRLLTKSLASVSGSSVFSKSSITSRKSLIGRAMVTRNTRWRGHTVRAVALLRGPVCNEQQ
jgi:hypothetical protein